MIAQGMRWVRINCDESWREKVGMLLRYMACRIDGRRAIAIEILTIPPISENQKIRCINHGLKEIGKAVSIELDAELMESILERQKPLKVIF